MAKPKGDEGLKTISNRACHNKYHTCKECDLLTNSKRSTKSCCPECNIKLPSRGKLLIHLRRIHKMAEPKGDEGLKTISRC